MELCRASPSCGPDINADRVTLTNFYRWASALDERDRVISSFRPAISHVRAGGGKKSPVGRQGGLASPRAYGFGLLRRVSQLVVPIDAVVLDGAGSLFRRATWAVSAF